MNSGPSGTWALINPGFLAWSNWEYYYPALDRMQVHSTVIPSPPFQPLAFYQVSLTNFCYPFIHVLLGGDRHCTSKVFCTRTQHMDWNPDLLTLSPAQARLQMQTPWPWVHLVRCTQGQGVCTMTGPPADHHVSPRGESLCWILSHKKQILQHQRKIISSDF